MYRLYSHGEDIAYGIYKFVADNVEDVYNISTNSIAPGSSVFVISDSITYVLDCTKTWKLVKNNNGDNSLGINNFWQVF